MGYITDKVRAAMGARSPKRTADDPISADALRRFIHATMEQDPIHLDEQAAAASRFGGLVAPLLYPMHAFRRALNSPDPLDRALNDPDWDGSSGGGGAALPPLDLPFERNLNGGSEVEFFRFARVGDVISQMSTYVDAFEKESKSGPMVLVISETEFTNQEGEPLFRVRRTDIRR